MNPLSRKTRRPTLKQSLRIFLLLVTLCTLLTACGGTTGTNTAPTPVTLNVFAASSLTESFTEIGMRFQSAHPGVTVKFNFAGSPTLVQQITAGAAADVFASADQANMKKVTDAGLADNAQIFVKNRLVVIIPVSNPGNINTLKDLAKKGVKIDIGAPAVPAGKYSLQALDNMARSPDYGPTYEAAVKANFVSQEDNVKAVVQKVQLGEADAGFVYRTDVAADVSGKVKVIDIPDNFNVIAEYPIAVLKNSAHASDGQAFMQYVLSADGQAILMKYNFITVSSS
jgi:molybdate transport system substrate-binding protein